MELLHGKKLKEIKDYINLVMQNLNELKDETGEFLLHFGDLEVDDKSFSVWNWPQGVGLFGIYKYYQMTKDENALFIVKDWFEQRMIEGAPPKNVNTMAPLLTLAYLYEDTKDCRYLPFLEDWANWAMYDMARTDENGMQHITYGVDNDNQIWDDTLMMTLLPLAKIGLILDKPEFIEEVKKQFLIHIKYLSDKKTGLWFHGFNFDGHHNFAEVLWGRGNCWITISFPEIIDILDLKEGDFFREFLLATLVRQIDELAKLQDDSGLWHTVLNDDTSYLEASATAGFCYGILKAVNKRYIDKKYADIAIKGIEGLLKEIGEDGAVHKVSVGTGMGNSADFYKEIAITTMPYGQSLTILCLSEYLRLFI